MSIQERKAEHVSLTALEDVAYRKPAGFERYQFVHNALPEIDPEDVDLSAALLGRTFSFPLFISSMTGGTTEAGEVNRIIARFCEKHNLPFGVGSQRAMLEKPEQVRSFSVVRKEAPAAFIAANIGGAQLRGDFSREKVERLIESIRADAIIVHLNPLQELMQPEGDRNFRGIRSGIENLAKIADIPIIVKETGAGISGPVAERLLSVGASVIDVAGAGGTSWAKVENLRKNQTDPKHSFDDWGIPTVDCLRQVALLKENYDFELIASGGIRGSFDIVKSLALGADFTAAAQPVIKAVVHGGYDALEDLVLGWKNETRLIFTLLGCHSVSEISRKHVMERK